MHERGEGACRGVCGRCGAAALLKLPAHDRDSRPSAHEMPLVNKYKQPLFQPSPSKNPAITNWYGTFAQCSSYAKGAKLKGNVGKWMVACKLAPTPHAAVFLFRAVNEVYTPGWARLTASVKKGRRGLRVDGCILKRALRLR